jgi:hypothetical protein
MESDYTPTALAERNFPFEDALLCLQELGLNSKAHMLIERWSDVPVSEDIKNFNSNYFSDSPPAWIARFYDMRFSQEEVTAWLALFSQGIEPDDATTEIAILRRRNG